MNLVAFGKRRSARWSDSATASMIGYAVTASITIPAGATSQNGEAALGAGAVGQMRAGGAVRAVGAGAVTAPVLTAAPPKRARP